MQQLSMVDSYDLLNNKAIIIKFSKYHKTLGFQAFLVWKSISQYRKVCFLNICLSVHHLIRPSLMPVFGPGSYECLGNPCTKGQVPRNPATVGPDRDFTTLG